MKPNSPERPALRVALTGGIACGKSEVARILAGEGARVVDADTLAHAVLRSGTPVFEAVVRTFGPKVVGTDGEIDRPALGRLVFADAGKRTALNALVHPEVMRRLEQDVESARRSGQDVAAVIPLLFEVGAERGWDAVICVAADGAIMEERLRARGLSDREARARMAAQWPITEKMKRSDWIIENNGSLSELAEVTRRVWKKVLMQKEKEDHG